MEVRKILKDRKEIIKKKKKITFQTGYGPSGLPHIGTFGNQISKSGKNSIKLPDLEFNQNKINFDEIRAVADSKSLKFRLSNSKTLKKFEPEGNISKRLYNISEKIRCEMIGSSYFKGVKNNIEKFYLKRISGLDLKKSEDKIAEAFENYLRVKFLDFKNNSQIDSKVKIL